MNEKTILVWFRNDLRVHDNEILFEAAKRADLIVPVFCFDPRYFADTTYGTKKTGALRARFLLESVIGLRQSLQALGGDLLVRTGLPEEVLPEICREYAISEVYHHREVAAEETDISEKVEAALWKQQINLKHFIGHTLYHKEDLPFPIRDIPDAFTVFRKKIDRDSSVRSGFRTPEKVVVPLNMETGLMPELSAFGFEDLNSDHCRFLGGEQNGLKKLAEFLSAQQEQLPKASRGVTRSNSGLSPWLSTGCLSPREVYWQLRTFEKEHPSSNLATNILLELQWRDYFRFMLKKHGSTITSGMQELLPTQVDAFSRWKEGRTGTPMVDACMSELNQCGYINHKCRQYVALYLTKELDVSWRAGAAFFEEKLIDHSPASNWGNWTYMAGEGVMSVNRPVSLKPDQVFEEEYIKQWLPKLKELH